MMTPHMVQLVIWLTPEDLAELELRAAEDTATWQRLHPNDPHTFTAEQAAAAIVLAHLERRRYERSQRQAGPI